MNAFGKKEPKVVPLDLSENQFQIYSSISPNYTHSFLFESLTGPSTLSETSVMGFDPQTILRVYRNKIIVTGKSAQTIKTKDPFSQIKDLLGKSDDASYRYLGGAVGTVSYDAVGLFEDVAQDSNSALMEFGIYDDGILYDKKKNKPYYFYHDYNRFDELKTSGAGPKGVRVSEIGSGIKEEEFGQMVKKAKKYIHDGDIFQAVLSRRFPFEITGDALAVYAKLREMNPSPYMYHAKQGQKTVIGASPEMLIRVTKDTAETFPIAGTRKVTGDTKQDEALASELLQDQKELAEHTMLVDLGRNDIGRVCKYGSVRVEELMKIKQFSHVQHMVSHVTGTLDKDKDMFDAFRAVFPAGTVSGAPKVRAMEIIGELEPHLRGPYAGAVGYFAYNGCCDFAIAIRSIFIDGTKGFVQAGAGIVSDSDPKSEFDETQHKADAMICALREASD